MKRKIAIVSGGRSDYGLLYWIIRGIHEDPDLQLQLIVTGMHLSPEFGMTVKVIDNDGFPIADKVEMLLSSDTESAIATSMGLGMIGFAKAYARLKPDLIIVLGDRFEILSAVTSAIPFKIPVAHIHGGELTEGAIDDLCRHAITKMSHIHFPATELCAQRIKQMGENPDNIFCFGSPSLDNFYRLELMSRKKLCEALCIPVDKRIGIITYHPVTIEKDSSEVQVLELLKAIKSFSDIYWVFTMPNADTGGRIIFEILNDFVNHNSGKAKAFISLGRLKYLSLLKYASVMIGNSSSGLIEAPSFGLPTINIGSRQDGRERGINVIDVHDCRHNNINAAVIKALSDKFKNSLKDMENPYGTGNASSNILKTIKSKVLIGITKKSFYNI